MLDYCTVAQTTVLQEYYKIRAGHGCGYLVPEAEKKCREFTAEWKYQDDRGEEA